MTFKITWHDGGREPQNPPNPKHPNGMNIDMSNGRKACMIELPYPAPRCGVYLAVCET